MLKVRKPTHLLLSHAAEVLPWWNGRSQVALANPPLSQSGVRSFISRPPTRHLQKSLRHKHTKDTVCQGCSRWQACQHA